MVYTSNMRRLMNEITHNSKSPTPCMIFLSLAQAGSLRRLPMAVGLSKNHKGPVVSSYELELSQKLDVYFPKVATGLFLILSNILIAEKWSRVNLIPQVFSKKSTAPVEKSEGENE